MLWEASWGPGWTATPRGSSFIHSFIHSHPQQTSPMAVQCQIWPDAWMAATGMIRVK